MSDPRDGVTFTAREVPYSSVVGSSVMLCIDGGPCDGMVIGQLALLCFGDKDQQLYWAKRLTRALNNGAKAETAIARFVERGLIKTMRECEPGKGAPVRANKGPIDVRAFVKSLDGAAGESNNGAAIRGDEAAPHKRADGQDPLSDVPTQAGGTSVV